LILLSKINKKKKKKKKKNFCKSNIKPINIYILKMKYILTVLSTLIFTIQAYGKAFNSQILLTNSVKDFECPSFDVVACSENQDLVNKCCVPDQGHLVLSLQWLPRYI